MKGDPAQMHLELKASTHLTEGDLGDTVESPILVVTQFSVDGPPF